MSDRVTFGSNSSGALVLPDGKGPGVVVVQEWWGIDAPKANVVAIAERLAKEGFVALVPDLYHGKNAQDADEAGALMKALDFPKAVGELADAKAYLAAHPQCTGKVAVMGYCMGGALSLAAAVNVRGWAAVVPYYGLPGDLDWSKIDAPVQAHFATHDDWATVAGAEKIKAAVPGMELHIYEAQHAFCNERRPEVHDAAAAQLAWSRTIAFLRAHAH